MAHSIWLDWRKGLKVFRFFKGSRLAVSPTHSLNLWILGVIDPVVKRQGFEANYLPPSIAEVKNGWKFILIPHTPSCFA
jgi:hypothetical protein